MPIVMWMDIAQIVAIPVTLIIVAIIFRPLIKQMISRMNRIEIGSLKSLQIEPVITDKDKEEEPTSATLDFDAKTHIKELNKEKKNSG
ncbi:MAG: hypothetical protein GTO45_40375 [Candidatus Aminicenantes bacterium]|nr:hypothetical protein [Candidatus Aminicenantes bacterium]NIN91040.1 hypothetical protein [Candidatus Aminicenantes bacterium]NIO87829.1 hypothetical protein [Candidatus Aminicenantes bacterium]NIR12032.1 hypothetical protein [Candidatus Aminicenantes bacterium]NIT29673.1 hypothetical protein [Candidatus Aminicenantes bacterium]